MDGRPRAAGGMCSTSGPTSSSSSSVSFTMIPRLGPQCDAAENVVQRLWCRSGGRLLAAAELPPPYRSPEARARFTAASVREPSGNSDGGQAPTRREKGFPLVEYRSATLPERIGQFALLGGIWACCQVFMFCLNATTLVNVEAAHDALLRREKGRALITVSNHISSMDDPLMIACVMPPSVAFSPSHIRWTPCATDRCFRTESLMREAFFRLTKVVPLERGGGTRFRQRGIEELLCRLEQGDWVHWFPEGTRGASGSIGEMKVGIGKLICAAVGRDGESDGASSSSSSSLPLPPIVIPIVHRGLDLVCPRSRAQNIIPLSTGHSVTISVGESITEDVIRVIDEVERDQRSRWRGDSRRSCEEEKYRRVAALVGERLRSINDSIDSRAAG